MKNIANEKGLEKQIRKVLQENINNQRYKVLENKDVVDIIISNNQKEYLYFIEVKYYVPSHFRLQIGQKKGSGFQPEILQNQYPYFEKYMRWILGHKALEGYWFVDNNIIRQYASGGKIEKKYNSIHKTIFEQIQPLTLEELVKRVKHWLEQ